LATAQPGDAEMARRIRRHQERRPASWQTIEEPWDLAASARSHPDGTLLLECCNLWLTNLLIGLPGRDALDDAAVRRAVAELASALEERNGRSIVVSNEVGCGIIPENPLARRFGDVLGEANQVLAAAATEVYWCVAGIPVRIKGPAVDTP